MANASSTGFGMKPVKMAGQAANTAGLGEYPVAASSSAIYNQDLVAMANTFRCDAYEKERGLGD